MSYKPTMILKYDGLEIEPTPQISIDREPIYASDNIIGYNHVITINGFASSVLYSQNRTISNTQQSLRSLDMIQKILQRNGKSLTLDNCEGVNHLTAYGGHLRDFNVEEGNWYNYIKYSATIEFSNLIVNNEFMGIHPESVAVIDGLTSEYLYRIKSFDDKWNFTIPENEAYLYYARLARVSEEAAVPVAEDYTQINVEYTIKAQGKHYYLGNISEAAWENAKNFVQDRLFYQISAFRDGNVLNGALLSNNSYDSNDIGNDINFGLTSTISIPVSPPILDRSIIDRYKVYNETIDCSTSEADGSFTATYKCVLKRYDPTIASFQHSTHAFTVNYEQNNDFDNTTRVISINGSVQGLLPTNILANVDDGQNLILPNNGLFFFVSDDLKNKYYYAWKDAKNFVLNATLDDLNDNFKQILEINYASLFPETSKDSPCLLKEGYNLLYSLLAEPKNFSINHNYNPGTVEYSASYDTERACIQELGFNSITITEKDSVPSYVEHVVVGRTQGPIIQDLNTNKPKSLTIKFDGVTRKGCIDGNPFSEGYELQDPRFTGIAAEVCDTDSYVFLPFLVRAAFFATEKGAELVNGKLITKSNNASYNPADGSYSVSKTYTVCPPYPIEAELCDPNKAIS